MSILTKTKTLYELLLRFDVDGKLAGAHAQYLVTITEDGKVVNTAPGQALPVSLTDAADKLTLRTILGEALAPAIEAKEVAEAAAADALAKVEAVAGLVAAKEQLEAKDAIIQDLMAQMAPVK